MLLVTLVACAPPPPVPSPPDAGPWFASELSPCARQGPQLRTVDDVIARLQALPQPVSVACFTASLPRPLAVVGTTSRFSAQPAGGPLDPRLFLFSEGLILSLVTEGDGKDLLEVGELITPTRTLKAEFKFPLTGSITRDDAYAHLDYGPTVSSCGLCHAQEERHDAHPVARVSLALKPPPRSLVSLDRLREFAAACDVETQRERCLRWQGLFGFGDVRQGAFPAEFADFIR
jgi:hypothetical protein